MKAGNRVKADRRDAIMLAKLHRAGKLINERMVITALQKSYISTLR